MIDEGCPGDDNTIPTLDFFFFLLAYHKWGVGGRYLQGLNKC